MDGDKEQILGLCELIDEKRKVLKRLIEIMDVLEAHPAWSVSERLVYFIYCEQIKMVKIGLTTDLKSRLAALRASYGLKLTVAAVIENKRDNGVSLEDQESDLHERFTAHRTKGEWFRLSSGILEYILLHIFLTIPALEKIAPEEVRETAYLHFKLKEEESSLKRMEGEGGPPRTTGLPEKEESNIIVFDDEVA